MDKTYLLPCPCGKGLPVAIRQAGQTVSCECGQPLEVPPLNQLRRLEAVVPDVPETPVGSWGARQQVMIVGAVILLLALFSPINPLFPGGVVSQFNHWAQPPHSTDRPAHFQAWVAKLRPAQAWDEMEALQRTGLVPVQPREVQIYEEAVFRCRVWLGVTLVFAALGLVILLAGAFVVRSKAG